MPDIIPRRIVYRALADVLGGQARRLESLADRAGKPARPGRVPSGSKAVGRDYKAAAYARQADAFSRRVADPAAYNHPGLDAELFGLLIAVAYGHGDALNSLRSVLVARGLPRVLDDLAGGDMITIVDRLLSLRFS